MKPIKVAFTTLGCKVNQDETGGMQVLFEQSGYETVDFKDQADVYIVNTCTVTHLGSRKSRQLLRQARRRNPQGFVVAAGCYPQAASEELADLTEIDLIIGNSHKSELVQLVQAAMEDRGQRIFIDEPEDFKDLPVSVTTSRHRATLKIQEGCQRFCTYCIVPKARGRLRSMPLENIVHKAGELVEAGFREIVLTGINLTSYGKEIGGIVDLAKVVESMAPQVLPARIRISSVESTDFTPQLIKAIGDNSNVCRHFHIPLQSGSNSVLQRMGRKYSADEFLALVDTLKKQFDLPSFTTDIIVGFPGETDHQFAQTMEIVKEVGFCKLHVFRYSPRPGTPAASFKEQVAPLISSRRSELLIELGKKQGESFAAQLMGIHEELLVEEASELEHGLMVGHGERYLRIHCPTDAKPGSLINVGITGQSGADLIAVQV